MTGKIGSAPNNVTTLDAQYSELESWIARLEREEPKDLQNKVTICRYDNTSREGFLTTDINPWIREVYLCAEKVDSYVKQTETNTYETVDEVSVIARANAYSLQERAEKLASEIQHQKTIKWAKYTAITVSSIVGVIFLFMNRHYFSLSEPRP